MANIKQQKKRILTDEAKRLRNKSFKSKIKTTYKKAVLAVNSNDESYAKKVKLVIKLLDRAKAKKIKHRNYVDRKKSQLHTLLNKQFKNKSTTKQT